MTSKGRRGQPSDVSLTLLYDGVCGFCNRTIQTVLAWDKRNTMHFATLQGDYAKGVFARHPELEGIDSLILVENDSATGEEHVWTRSTAALRVAAYLGGVWKLLLPAFLVPTPIRDFFYKLFARHRYALFGKSESCLLPPAEVRERFLDR